MGAPHFWGPCAGAPVAHAQGRAWLQPMYYPNSYRLVIAQGQ